MTDLVWTALALVAKGFTPAMPGATRGSFFVATEADRTAVELCLKEHDRTGLEVVEGGDAVVIGRTVTLSFDPKPGWASVAKDLDELLDEPGNRIRAKSRFLVLDTKQSSDDLLDQATEVGRYMHRAPVLAWPLCARPCGASAGRSCLQPGWTDGAPDSASPCRSWSPDRPEQVWVTAAGWLSMYAAPGGV